MSRFAACALALLTSGQAWGADAVRPVPAPQFPNARQPQLAIGLDGVIHLAFGTDDGLFHTSSRDGKSFTPPSRVGAFSGGTSIAKRRGPRIAATPEGLVITCGGKTREEGPNILAWRSDDGGRTWQGPSRVNRIAGSAPEGLHALAVSPKGTLVSVWLDHRTGGGQQVFAARSRDGGRNWEPDRLVYESPDGSVCPCCQPLATYDAAGRLHVMFRNAIGGARDMYLMTSTDDGNSFGRAIKLGQGTWELNRCPMDAGGLAGGVSGPVLTIWRRGQEIFTCVPGQAEEKLGKGEQGWAAAGPDGIYLVWLEARPGVLRLATPLGKPSVLAASASDPVIASRPDGRGPVVAAWEEGPAGKLQIRLTIVRD